MQTSLLTQTRQRHTALTTLHNTVCTIALRPSYVSTRIVTQRRSVPRCMPPTYSVPTCARPGDGDELVVTVEWAKEVSHCLSQMPAASAPTQRACAPCLRRARAVDFVAHRSPLPPHVEEIFLAHNPPPSCWNERIGKRDWEDALRKWSKSRKAVYRALQR